MKIDIGKEFSKTPFGRYYKDGPYSAQAFREKLLYPIFSNEINSEEVVVDFSNVSLSLGSSFLEEAFGGLVREGISKETLLQRLHIRSKYPIYEARIKDFIDRAS